MIFRILKNDLWGKKNISLILLILIILSSIMFTCGSNILYVSLTGINYFLQESNAGDENILVNSSYDSQMLELKGQEQFIISAEKIEFLMIENNNFVFPETSDSISAISNILVGKVENEQNRIFTLDNGDVNVNYGEIALPVYMQDVCGISVGDKIKIKAGDYEKVYRVTLFFKDAMLGSSYNSVKRFVVSDRDYARLNDELDEMHEFSVWAYEFDESYDSSYFQSFFSDNCKDITAVATWSYGLLSTALFLDNGIIAAVLLFISCIVIVISILILNYVIKTVMTDEFKQIGILKAIGLPPIRIKTIFLIKYMFLTISGCVIGFFVGNYIVSRIVDGFSKSMMISGELIGVLIGIVSNIILFGIILFLSYLTMRKINKHSPIKFIREDSFEEKTNNRLLFLKKRKRINPAVFMSLNDLYIKIGNYVVLLLVFVLCILLVIIPLNLNNTILDDSFIENYGGATKGDFYITDINAERNITGYYDVDTVIEDLDKVENSLKEYCSTITLKPEYYGSATCISDDEKKEITIVYMALCKENKEYAYESGRGPIKNDEIAISTVISLHMDKKIGDTIKIKFDDEAQEFKITGTYQSITNTGNNIRMADEFDIKNASKVVYIGFYNTVDDSLDFDMLNNKITENDNEIVLMDLNNYLKSIMGNVQGLLKIVVGVTFALSCFVIFILTYLFVTLFINREIAEIALLKSIGVNRRNINIWQGFRIVIVLIISIIVGSILSIVLGEKIMSIALSVLGLTNIQFVINQVQVYVIIPLIIFVLVVTAIMLGLRKINSVFTWNIVEA